MMGRIRSRRCQKRLHRIMRALKKRLRRIGFKGVVEENAYKVLDNKAKRLVGAARHAGWETAFFS